MMRASNAYTLPMRNGLGLDYSFQLSTTLCARLTYSEVQEHNQPSAQKAYHNGQAIL